MRTFPHDGAAGNYRLGNCGAAGPRRTLRASQDGKDPMAEIEQRWRCDDGFLLPATVHAPAQPRAALLIASAMAVPRQFYRKFAQALAQRGIAVLTFDYRGIGDAAATLPDPAATTVEDWARHDLETALAETERQFPGVPAFLLGHSVGAQLPGLAPRSENLAGMIFVAGSRPHVRHWRGGGRAFLFVWWYLVVPLACLRRAWFPARALRFAPMDIPAGVKRQWAAWARRPRYLWTPALGLDTRRYRSLAVPALSYEFSDDPYAPEATVSAFLSEWPKLEVTRRRWQRPPGHPGLGHMGFFKAEGQPLWQEAADWLLARAGGAAPLPRRASA